MADLITVFCRREKKYLITPQQKSALISAIKPYVVSDPYGNYTVSNLYFDTDDFAVIDRSLDIPYYKEKLRMRSYAVPKLDDAVFFEIKKKVNGVVYKRRFKTAYEDALKVLRGDPIKIDGQIPDEVKYHLDRTGVKPKVLVIYEREPFFWTEDNKLRITFDTNIRYRLNDIEPGHGDDGIPLDLGGLELIEIKTSGGYPLWLTKILSDLKIYPQTFSKYGRIYLQMSKEK